jgi:ubiquinone biosynthesis protein COQ4
LEPLAAIKSMIRLVRNPTHTHEVFTIIKALSGSDLQKGLDRFKRTEFGEKVLRNRLQLRDSLKKRNLLAKLPAGSLGREYQKFVQEENLSADGLEKANERSLQAEITDPELKLFAARQRDMHDLWHVVTGYGRDELGEACLLAFTYAQNKNRGVGFIAFVGCFKLFANYRFNALKAILQGYRIGREAAWLPEQDWESLLANQLNNVRDDLNISKPSRYLTSLSA